MNYRSRGAEVAGEWRAAIGIAITTICLAAGGSGCVYVDVTESTVNSGAAHLLGDPFQTVHVGVTDQESVERLFGPPAAIDERDNGSRLMTYVYETRTTRRKRIPFVFDRHATTSSVRLVKFELQGGKVVRFWQEFLP